MDISDDAKDAARANDFELQVYFYDDDDNDHDDDDHDDYDQHHPGHENYPQMIKTLAPGLVYGCCSRGDKAAKKGLDRTILSSYHLISISYHHVNKLILHHHHIIISFCQANI